MEKAEKKYKAVVVVVVKKLQGVFVATCGGVDWTSRPSYLWKKLVQNALLPEPGGGAGTSVFSQNALLGGFKCTQPDNQLKNT